MEKEIEVLSYFYEGSDNAIAQGKKWVKYYEDRGYYKKNGGNGSFVMVRPSVAEMTVSIEGKAVTQSIKELVREAYGVKNVTKSKVEKFFEDCKSGNIKLKSDSDGEYFYI